MSADAISGPRSLAADVSAAPPPAMKPPPAAKAVEARAAGRIGDAWRHILLIVSGLLQGISDGACRFGEVIFCQLALALMELLVQVGRQTSTVASRPPQEAPRGRKADF